MVSNTECVGVSHAPEREGLPTLGDASVPWPDWPGHGRQKVLGQGSQRRY